MKILHFSALACVALGFLTTTSCVSSKRYALLERRVDELSTQLTSSTADADSDGVPDLRDLEPRTPADVEVDRYGRTVVKKTEPVYQPPTPTQPAPTQPTPTQPTPTNPTNSMGVPVNPTPVPEPNTGRDEGEGGAGEYHVVVKGDTLFSLARRYNTSVQAIRQLNGMSDNSINVGQRLRVH